MNMTYSRSGVDISKENEAIKALSKRLKFRRKGIGAPLIGIGHYAGLIDLGEFALAITTDGVGSKVLIANAIQKWDTIGIDCIAMNVNDLLAIGAEPLAFVDYLAMSHPHEQITEQIGIGLQKGAEISKISVVGGELATLPEIVNGFDLAGTCVGLAPKEQIITGEKVDIGDSILGFPSSGIHSNGLTLARKVIENSDYSYRDPFPPNPQKNIGEELLTPTRVYMEVLDLIKKFDVHGLAHITGSGLLKLNRLPKGFRFDNPLDPHNIFKFLQKEGKISNLEMYKTFNMGMGFLVILSEKEAKKASKITDGKIVGEVVEKGITVKDIVIK